MKPYTWWACKNKDCKQQEPTRPFVTASSVGLLWLLAAAAAAAAADLGCLFCLLSIANDTVDPSVNYWASLWASDYVAQPAE